MFQNKGMAASLVYQTNPPGIYLYLHANIFFCFSNQYAGHVSENALCVLNFSMLNLIALHYPPRPALPFAGAVSM